MKFLAKTPPFWLLLLLPWASSGQNRVLALDEIVQLGLANSKQLQASAARFSALQARTGQTRDATFPAISYTGTYTRLSENIEPFVIRLPDGTEQALNPLIPNQYGNRLSVSEPVFTGLRALNTIRAAEFLENAGRYDLERDRKDVQLNLLNAAINLYKLQEARRVFARSLATAQNRLTDTRNLRDQGLALDNDVLKAELALAQLETARAETDNAIAAAQYTLDVLVGLPETTTVEVDSSSVFAGEATAESLAVFTSNAGNRADFLAANQRALASEKQWLVSKGMYYPLISVGANLYDNRPNQRVFPPEDRFKSTWDAGVTLSWNLSSFYTARHSVQEARFNWQQAGLLRDQLSDGARTEIANNYYSWQTARQRIELAEKSIVQAVENQRITQLRTGQQVASTTDLLEADALLLQTQINRVSARADARLAYFRLLKSAGKL